jgi:2-polyprenyl-6-methoxyphenol hydroxylase-like FAD-dependent oxidoreductase
MGIEASRVGIVGGSIAGCAAAIALSRIDCEVTVYERSRGQLKSRGLGINMPPAAFDQLVSAGYLDEHMPTHAATTRVWFAADGSATGKVVWRQDMSLLATNWGVLWDSLRTKVPDSAYRHPVAVTAVRAEPDGAVIVSDEGEDRVDVVVGADGYRSVARALVDPQTRPIYAGYAFWRGDLAADLLPGSAPEELGSALVTVGFDGGHAVFYLIPNLAGDGLRLNWGIYSRLPDRFDDPTSLPPGSLGDELLTALDQVLAALPPYWAEVAKTTGPEHLSLQPIYDIYAESYVRGRILLAGDAGTLARPHTGIGALKAVQDAHALELACRNHDSWPDALATYDQQRRTAGNGLVELGQRLGRSLVTQTPPWADMKPADYDEWVRATLAGRHHSYES